MQQNSSGETPSSTGISRLLPLFFYLGSLLTAVCAAYIMRGYHPETLASLPNFMGPLAESVAQGHGYVVCSDAMSNLGNAICFHANRMPLPPLLLAGLIRIFGAHDSWVELAKMAIVLFPIAAAVALVEKRLRNVSSASIRFFVPALLFLSLALPTQLIDVVNMQVEEGYSFCLLAYALAVLLFGAQEKEIPQKNTSWSITFFFALSVLALYLTKSSMIAVVLFLGIAYCMQVRDAGKCLAVLLIVLCGPLGWGLYTLRATGRFSVGTSVDGINLHKGNYPEFLGRYPPTPGVGLDQYDAALSAGQHFPNEWAFNAYHIHAAENYMRTHPARTLRASFWKAEVFFVSIRKIGSQHYAGWLGWVTDGSMILFRLLLWSACGMAIWQIFRGTETGRRAAIVYFGTVLAVAAPYVVGFALTRHAGILALPSALFLGWVGIEPTQATRDSIS